MLAAISGELCSSNQGGWSGRSAAGGVSLVGLGDGSGSGTFTFGSPGSTDARVALWSTGRVWGSGAGSLGRNPVLLDHLEQLRDAQLVHAGPQVMSLGPQVFVHALRQPNGDNPGRLALGISGILLFAKLHQPLLDLLELRAFFKGREVF